MNSVINDNYNGEGEESGSVSVRVPPLGDFSETELPIVVSMPKATRDASKGSSQGWLEARSVVSGLQEAVADLYLLSRAQILIGTVGSTFSQTAKLMSGDAFFLTAGAHLELKN